MKARGLIVACLLATLPAQGEDLMLSERAIHALTPIDSVPSKEALIALLPNPIIQLEEIARSSTMDFGVRLRAIRALPHFCSATCGSDDPALEDPVHRAIVGVLEAINLADTSGREVLRLRAAIEALGQTRSNLQSDVGRLVPFLDHESRDIRVASARALRDLCNTHAIAPLRARYQQEPIAQVRLAISAALRDLGQCS